MNIKLMRKIYHDLAEYLLGAKSFMPAPYTRFALIYPMDLDWALAREKIEFSPKDDAGIPMYNSPHHGAYYNPTRIAAYSFAHWNRFTIYGDENSKFLFLKGANWLHTAAPDGRLTYPFSMLGMPSGWISALAQCEAAGIMALTYYISGELSWLQSLHLFLQPIFKTVPQGGVLRYFETGEPFLEEYPTILPSFTLNGSLIAIACLDLAARIMPDQELEYFVSDLLRGIEVNLRRWDTGNWTTYDLSHEFKGGLRNWCTATYQNIHSTMIAYLGYRFKRTILSEAGERWANYANSLPNRLRALKNKSVYRLKNPSEM